MPSRDRQVRSSDEQHHAAACSHGERGNFRSQSNASAKHLHLQQPVAATTAFSALKPQHQLAAAYQHLEHPRHALLQISTCTSGPQPVHNLAPFSYFNMMSHSPATVAIGITRSDNKERAYGKKDTLANIEETGHLVINSMNKW